MKKKKLLKNNSPIFSVLISVLIGIIITAVLLLISAKILTVYDIDFGLLKYIWIAISLLSGFFIGITAGKSSKSKSIIWGAVSALIAATINILVLSVFSGFNISLFILLIIPSYILTGAAGAVISSNLR